MDGSTRASGPDHRAFQRRFVNASLRIRLFGHEEPYSATLNNYSRGGLYIATPVFLQPGTKINVETPKQDIFDMEMDDEIDAKVVWCWKDIRAPAKRRDQYEIGARWYSPRCDWCDEVIPYQQFYQSREMVTLCQQCREDLEKNVRGRLGQNIYRYLMGNVV